MAGDEPPPPPPPKIEPTSPSYLGPQDRPGDFITPIRLNGDNYAEWVDAIQTALEARRKFVFLDGTITQPALPCTSTDWTTINAMLISWLMNSIEPEVKRSLSKFKEVQRLWDTLKTRFAIVNGPRIHQLKSSIARCEQTKTMSVQTYFSQLSVLWEELHHHQPLISCTCSANNHHATRRETNKLHAFLMGLDSDFYSQTRSNILAQDPPPSLDKAYQLVIQDERVRLATSPASSQPPVVGFAVQAPAGRGCGNFTRPDKSHLTCSHCPKIGHVVSQCFELHGDPAWYEEHLQQCAAAAATASRGGRGRGGPAAHTLLLLRQFLRPVQGLLLQHLLSLQTNGKYWQVYLVVPRFPTTD